MLFFSRALIQVQFQIRFAVLSNKGFEIFCVLNFSDPGSNSLDQLVFGKNLMHVGEGIDAAAHNEIRCLSSRESGGSAQTRPNNSFDHAIALDAADASTMAKNGTSVDCFSIFQLQI